MGSLEEGMARVVKYDPFYAYLLNQFRVVEDPDVGTAGVAFINGRLTLAYNREFISRLSDDAVAIVLLHEVGHVIRGHLLPSFRRPDLNHEVLNIAMDSVINPEFADRVFEGTTLLGDKLASPEDIMAGNVQPGRSFVGASAVLTNYTAEELYNELMKNAQPQQGQGQQQQSGQGQTQQGSGQPQQCSGQSGQQQQQAGQSSQGQPQGSGQKQSQKKGSGKNAGQQPGQSQGQPQPSQSQQPGQGQQQVQGQQQQAGTIDNHDFMSKTSGSENEIMDTVKNAVEAAARQAGDVPAAIKDLIESLRNWKPALDWRKILRRFVGSNTAEERESTISRFSKRYGSPILGTLPKLTSEIVVGLDVSGSVSDHDLEIFLNEVRNISKILGTKITAIQGDTQVEDISKIKKSTKEFERKAAGGTDLQPIIDIAARMKKPLVLFTDGFLSQGLVIKTKTLIVVTSNGTTDIEAKGARIIQLPKE